MIEEKTVSTGASTHKVMQDRLQTMEKQLAEARASMLQKEQLSQLREQAYSELLHMVAAHGPTKTDKILVHRLKEIKMKYADIFGSASLISSQHPLP